MFQQEIHTLVSREATWDAMIIPQLFFFIWFKLEKNKHLEQEN